MAAQRGMCFGSLVFLEQASIDISRLPFQFLASVFLVDA